MIEFRDRIAKEKGIEMLEYINQDGVKQGINPFDHGSAYTDIMKTQALKQRSTNTALRQRLAAAEETRRNQEPRSESSPSEMKPRMGSKEPAPGDVEDSTTQESKRARR